MAEQEQDPNADYPFPVPKMEDYHIIYIKSGTYQLLKKYVALQEKEDDLCKSDDDRILDLLLKVFNADVYAAYKMREHKVIELEKSQRVTPLYLRPQTDKHLRIYTYVIETMRDYIHNVDEALLHLITQEILELTIKGLEADLEEYDKKQKEKEELNK